MTDGTSQDGYDCWQGTYDHKQFGLWFLMPLTVVAVFLLEPVAFGAGGGLAALSIFQLVVVVLCLFCASATAYLRVRDEGDRLSVRFGPVPLMGLSIPYDEMESAEPHERRPGCLAGASPRYGLWYMHGGWGACCISGSRFVKIRLRGSDWGRPARDVYVGTDEPERLAGFLRQRIGA